MNLEIATGATAPAGARPGPERAAAAKPRLVLAAPFGLGPLGTVRFRMLPIARRLGAYDVAAVIPSIRGYSVPRSRARERHEEEDEALPPGGPAIHTIPWSRVPGLRHPITMARYIVRIWKLRPSVLYVFKPKGYSGLAGIFFSLLTRTRVILDTDDWEGEGGWNDALDYPAALKRFFSFEEKWLTRHAGAVTVASRTLAEKVASEGVDPSRIYYIPNGLPDERAGAGETGTTAGRRIRERLHLGDATVILLYTRFFELDLDLTVEVLARLARRSDFRILVVGRGQRGEENRLLDLCLDRGLAGRLVYAGWVPFSEVFDYLEAADLAFLPYRDTLLTRARCSLKLIDLMTAGVPCVAGAVGEANDFIVHGESGFLADPREVDGFVTHAERLIADADLRARIAAGARRRIRERYTWDELAPGLGAFVERATRV